MGEFFVYIMYSAAFDRSYVGQTRDVERRLDRHNSGDVRSTRPFRPWVLVQAECYGTRGEAMIREKWYKSGRGRAEMDRVLRARGFR